MINPSQTAESGKPRRPWYHWVAILAGLFIVLVGVPLAILDITGRAALQRELDAIQIAGGPIDLVQLQEALPKISDEQNGLLAVMNLADQLNAVRKAARPQDALPILGQAELPLLGAAWPASIGHFHSTPREKRCYTRSGHRASPSGKTKFLIQTTV